MRIESAVELINAGLAYKPGCKNSKVETGFGRSARDNRVLMRPGGTMQLRADRLDQRGNVVGFTEFNFHLRSGAGLDLYVTTTLNGRSTRYQFDDKATRELAQYFSGLPYLAANDVPVTDMQEYGDALDEAITQGLDELNNS